MFGFFNIYKPVGMTSHDVVARVRRILKIKQVGHTGTLDPFAEGVLPVCISKATRLIEYLEDDKEYLAFVKFGESTTTYDREGEITFKSDKKVVESDINCALKNFEGEIEQHPPMYSAIKLNGKKLYEYARAGEIVEVQSRKVTINNIKLEAFDGEIAQIRVACSKGTYIRSIANDLGQNLGCGGHLVKLIRTKAGKFCVDNTVTLDEVEESPEKYLINPLYMLPQYRLDITDEEYKKVLNGQYFFKQVDNISDGDLLILVYNKVISAMAEINGNKITIKKVFV